MQVTFPSDLRPDRTVLSLCFDVVRRAFSRCVTTDEAVTAILMQSPNGTVYRVTIDNSGVVTTTAL